MQIEASKPDFTRETEKSSEYSGTSSLESIPLKPRKILANVEIMVEEERKKEKGTHFGSFYLVLKYLNKRKNITMTNNYDYV